MSVERVRVLPRESVCGCVEGRRRRLAARRVADVPSCSRAVAGRPRVSSFRSPARRPATCGCLILLAASTACRRQLSTRTRTMVHCSRNECQVGTSDYHETKSVVLHTSYARRNTASSKPLCAVLPPRQMEPGSPFGRSRFPSRDDLDTTSYSTSR